MEGHYSRFRGPHFLLCIGAERVNDFETGGVRV